MKKRSPNHDVQPERPHVPPLDARRFSERTSDEVVEPASPFRNTSSSRAPAGRQLFAVVNEFLGTVVAVGASRVELHSYLIAGMPYGALTHLTRALPSLGEQQIASVVGLSTRTLRRRKEQLGKFMPASLASKTWQFAETLAKAAEALGSKEDAARWMSHEAIGLDGSRPLDLMRTIQGAELVNDFLERLVHGVYN